MVLTGAFNCSLCGLKLVNLLKFLNGLKLLNLVVWVDSGESGQPFLLMNPKKFLQLLLTSKRNT